MQSLSSKAKKALTLLTTIALAFGTGAGISNAAATAGKVYLSFDNDALGANVSAFEGGVSAIADSPAAVGGIGGNGKAMKFTKNGQPWSGLNVLLAGATSYRYTDADHKVISLDVHAEIKSPIMLKLQATGAPAALKAVELQVGWNHLDVDMSTGKDWNANVEYNVLAIFPDFGADDNTYTGTAAVAPAGQLYYVDNISINGGTSADVKANASNYTAPSTLLTFEAADTLGAAAATGGFEGAVTAIADAPAGGNGTKALEITKKGAAWSGVNLVTFPADQELIDATHTNITMNYFSPESVNTPVQINVILAGSSAYISQALEAKPGWQVLTFDMSKANNYNASAHYAKVALFPNFVNKGDVPSYTGADAAALADLKYYVDNVGFNGAVTPAISQPRTAPSTVLTFETGDDLGALAVGAASGTKAQGGFEGADTSIAAAPAGGNGGNALKIVKITGSQKYAGVNMVIFTNNRITDGTNKVISFNYYSPKDASPVRIELIPYPNAFGTTVNAVKGWQTITIDMSTVAGWSASTEYAMLTLFPDFDKDGDNSAYYVDNLAFNGGVTPAIPVTVAPTNKTAASVSGTAKVGKSITASKGTWTGTPAPTLSYKWYRCTVSSTKSATAAPTSSMKCALISTAKSSTYKATSSDVNKYLRVLVTATNSKGVKYSLSKTTGKVVK